MLYDSNYMPEAIDFLQKIIVNGHINLIQIENYNLRVSLLVGLEESRDGPIQTTFHKIVVSSLLCNINIFMCL